MALVDKDVVADKKAPLLRNRRVGRKSTALRRPAPRVDEGPHVDTKAQPSRHRFGRNSQRKRPVTHAEKAASVDEAKSAPRDVPRRGSTDAADTNGRVSPPAAERAAKKESPLREEAFASPSEDSSMKFEVEEEAEADWDMDEPCDTLANGSSERRQLYASDGSKLPIYSAEEVRNSSWVLISGLPDRVSLNQVRGIFSQVNCLVDIGKVKREKGIAVVKLQDGREAEIAEQELQGRTFPEIPEAFINAQRIPESAGESNIR